MLRRWLTLIICLVTYTMQNTSANPNKLWKTIQADTFPYQLRYEQEKLTATHMLKELRSISIEKEADYLEALKMVINYQATIGNFQIVDSLIQIQEKKGAKITNQLKATRLLLDWLPCAQDEETNSPCKGKKEALKHFLKHNFISEEPNEAMKWHWIAKMLNDTVLIAPSFKGFTYTEQLREEQNPASYPGALLSVNRYPNSSNLIVSNSYKESIKFYEQDKKGNWIDVTEEAQLHQIPGGHRIYAVDINQDGYQDILILRNLSNPRKEYLYPSLLINQKDGTYKDMSEEAGLDIPQRSTCACFLDANQDGKLDIFLGGEKYPSLLFIQNEDGTFKESANNYGLITKPHHVVDCAALDINQDGKTDLMLSTFYHTNFAYVFQLVDEQYPFFVNKFRDIGYIGPYKGGQYMIGDFDGDQHIDFISNVDYSTLDKDVIFNILSGTSGPEEFPTLWSTKDYSSIKAIEQYPILTYAKSAINLDFGDSIPMTLLGGGHQLDEIYPTTLYQFRGNHYYYQMLALKNQPTHIHSMTVSNHHKTKQPIIWMKGGFPNSAYKQKIASYLQSDKNGRFFTVKLIRKDQKDALGSIITVTTQNQEGKLTRRTRIIQAISSSGNGAGQDTWFLPDGFTLEKIEVKWLGGEIQKFENLNLKKKNPHLEIVEK